MPGNRTKKRPRDYWSRYWNELASGFRCLCGYTVMWTSSGTVDHFIPWATVRGTRRAHLAYQWDNLRYSEEWFNRERKVTDVPDPFDVHDNWFERLLPSLELVATTLVPASERDRVKNALYWLGKHRKVMNKRLAFWTAYRTLSRDGAPRMSFDQLEMWAPLIARALRKNPQYLHPADQARLQAGTL